jgi:hypothetical protein
MESVGAMQVLVFMYVHTYIRSIAVVLANSLKENSLVKD